MPLRYGDLLSTLNQSMDGKVLPVIRLLKAWRDENMTYKKPKSYWLEILTYDAFNEQAVHPDDSYPVILADLFTYISERLSSVADGAFPVIIDPAMKTPLEADWSIDYWESFYSKIVFAKEMATNAINVEGLDDQKAQWKKLFGSLWPSDDAVSNSLNMKDSVLAGTAVISSSGSLFASATKTQNPIPVKPVRAYGE